MSSYSLCGYLAAVQMRETKTVLLEGKTDRKIFSRLFANIAEDVVMDTVDIVDDDVLPLGNRAAVEHICKESLGMDLPLRGMVDREYRGFEWRPVVRDEIKHYSGESIYWTRGHSVENYLLYYRYVFAFLEMRYPEEVKQIVREKLASGWEDVAACSAALSVSAYEAQLVDRSRGLARIEMWANEEEWGLKIDDLISGLEQRNSPTQQVLMLRDLYEENLKTIRKTPESNRWLVHGHLGWEWIWTGIGAILKSAGVRFDVVEQIALGLLEEKVRYLSEKWAIGAVERGDEYPIELVEWVSTTYKSDGTNAGVTEAA